MKTLNDFPFRQLSPLETQVLIALSLGEKQNKPLISSIGPDPMFLIIENKLKAIGANASKHTVAWLALLSNGIPGRGVMLAFTYYLMFKEVKSSFEDFCFKFHNGNGVPTDGAYSEFWDYQKKDGMNLLDLRSSWTDT